MFAHFITDVGLNHQQILPGEHVTFFVNSRTDTGYSWISICHVIYLYWTNLHHWFLASLAKWLSVQLRAAWLWVWVLLPDLLQFPSAIGKFLFMEERQDTSLYQPSILRFSWNFLISSDLKSWVVRQLMTHSYIQPLVIIM